MRKCVLQSILIDCYEVNNVNRFEKLLDEYNLHKNKLTYFIWTHPDEDHSVGIPGIIKKYVDKKSLIFIPCGLNRDCLNYRCPICNKKSNLFYIDMYMKNIIDKYYKEKRKFISFDDNLLVIEDNDEETQTQENNMMDIDDEEDIDNGEEEEESRENDLNGPFNDSINEVSEEDINKEAIPISDDSEKFKCEDESNEEQITIVDKYSSYIENYKKVIDKADLMYRNEILSIIHDNE